jgi:hypothetical protein
MPLDSQSKVRLGWLAIAAAPVLIVQAVRFTSGEQAVENVHAAQQVPSVPAVTSPVQPPRQMTNQQLEAAAWFKAQNAAASPKSPIDAPSPLPRVHVPKEESPLPSLRLGGVASRQGTYVASINNRIFAVGDQPAEQWTITSIDGESRVVRLESHDGRKIELSGSGVTIRE